MIKWFKRLWCAIFTHDLIMLRKYPDSDCSRLYCKRCNDEFGYNKALKVMVRWDADLAEIHEDRATAEEVLDELREDFETSKNEAAKQIAENRKKYKYT